MVVKGGVRWRREGVVVMVVAAGVLGVVVGDGSCEVC